MNAAVPDFVPIVSTSVPPTVPSQPSPPAVIEVKLAGAVVRVVSGMDDAMLTSVLRAIRASACSP